MMFENNKVLLGLMALVVLASGCTQGQDSSVEYDQNSGVVIKEFSAFPSEVFGGDQVRVHATVKNVGGAVADGATIRIFNLPSSWRNHNELMKFGSLQPPSPDAGIPAAPKEETVKLGAPDPGSGINIDFDVKGRLTYSYSTTGVTKIQLMSQERFRNTGATLSQPTIDNTGGPIQLSVKSRTPIVVYPDGDTASQLCVIVNNVGSGTPYIGRASNIDNYNKVHLNARVQSGDISLTKDFSGPIYLEDGQNGVGCWEISGVSKSNRIQQTVPIQITASHKYMEEVSSPVTVRGNN